MNARLLTWWTILRICLKERLVYRADFAMGTLMRFLPIVTQIFLWYAVFDACGANQLAGYSYEAFVAYYLLTMISRAFSSMPGLASGIARQVREGEIKKYLIQPVDMLGFLLLARVAHKMAYYAVAVAPFGLVFFLCRDYFPDLPPAAATHSLAACAGFVVALGLSFLLGFFLEASLVEALVTELAKTGIRAEETGDGLVITGGKPIGAEIETYNDHRIAMSFAVLGLRAPGMRIRNPGCVGKSFPGFWDELKKLYRTT